jgi:hypothetical protein
MTSGGDQLTILMILGCLGLGYAIVSLAIRGISKLMRASRPAPDGKSPLVEGLAADGHDREQQRRNSR